MQTSLEESKYKFQVVSWLEELARSKDSFKLAGHTNLPQHKTDERVTGYLNSRESHFQVMKTQYFLLLSFKILVALGLLVIGGLLVLNQKMNIGQFVAAEIIILLVIDSAEKLILNLENIFDTLTSLEKIGEVFDLELDNHHQSTLANDNIQGAIKVELQNVEFMYPGRNENVIRGIQYAFQPNNNYCITGNNGSGKSTLLHLMSGLYQPQKGTVCLNGLPLGNYNIPELYKKIGNGLIEETLFEGTFYENITLGRDFVSSADVFWALDKILLSDYIKTLPNGLDTQIDISGHKLSQSVTEKIIIARSIVNHPKLLLLESHLDTIEEFERKKIIDFLTDKSNGWTFIAISNDPYLKEKSDSVIKMASGEII